MKKKSKKKKKKSTQQGGKEKGIRGQGDLVRKLMGERKNNPQKNHQTPIIDQPPFEKEARGNGELGEKKGRGLKKKKFD